MKALLAILAIGAVGASIDWCTRGYALETEQPEEDTTTTKPTLSEGAKRKKPKETEVRPVNELPGWMRQEP